MAEANPAAEAAADPLDDEVDGLSADELSPPASVIDDVIADDEVDEVTSLADADEERERTSRGETSEVQEEGGGAGEAAASTAVVVKDPPYEYPTGPVEVEQEEMLPAGNLYSRWTATPGVPGEPWENVALTLKFEAMGAQDLTVGLAHKPGGKGSMYQLIIGNKGNLQVDLEKRQGRRAETVASTAGLLCASRKAHRYWVAVKNGRVDFGVGDVCGQRTVLSYQDADSPIEVRYVGFTCLRHRAVFRDIKMEAEVGGPLGEVVVTELEFVRAEGCDEGFSGEDKASLDAALEQYQRECESMKRRARKFGGVYSPPFLQDWVPWTIVKRLSWNRDSPIEGGIDRESKEEQEKRRLRAERFGGSEAEPPPDAIQNNNPLAARVDPDVAEMMTDEKRFARSQKFNISDQMWSIQAEEQGLTPADIFCVDPDRADPEPMATTFPHKIHIFSLDKTVCKQIRDNDVKAYFKGFEPKYVEWLSDWSFNVVFEDPEGAKKAAAAKSFCLPDTLPKELEQSFDEEGQAVTDLGAMGWRLGVPMCKIGRDRHGPKGQWVRLLLRCAEAQDILLARPAVAVKPEGPLVRRPGGGGRLPPAVTVAQELSGGDDRGAHPQDGRGRKRRRGGASCVGPEAMMGQALKAPRNSAGNARGRRQREEEDGGGDGGGVSRGRGGDRVGGHGAGAADAAAAAGDTGASPLPPAAAAEGNGAQGPKES